MAPFDLAAFARAADAAITTSASLDAIAAVLATEPGVVSVRVADYWLKSNPPRRDLVVVESVIMLLVAAVILVNLLVDLSYAAVDPRLRSNR